MASQEGLLDGFLGASGAAPGDLRAAAADPAFLVALLDHLMADDATVIAFCDDRGLPYDAPMRARQALPGGGSVHWT